MYLVLMYSTEAKPSRCVKKITRDKEIWMEKRDKDRQGLKVKLNENHGKRKVEVVIKDVGMTRSAEWYV